MAVESSPTGNWVDNNNNQVAYQNANAAVTFNDSGTNTTGIVIDPVNGVSPVSVTFANSTAPYSFAASGTTGITGPATVTLNGTAGVTFNNINTYTGATTINAGTLRINNANSIQNSTATVNVNGGLVFGPSVGTFHLGGLAGTGSIAMTDTTPAPVSLVVGSNGASTAYGGSLSGGGDFTKTGSGVLTLSGVNSYAGVTNITGGTLRLSPSATGNAIGVHFGVDQQGGADTLAATTSAGVSPASVPGVNLAMTHWNNASGATGSASNITNSAVRWKWRVGDLELDRHSVGRRHFHQRRQSIDGDVLNSNGTSTVTFTNIPYASYEVISYVGAEGGKYPNGKR